MTVFQIQKTIYIGAESDPCGTYKYEILRNDAGEHTHAVAYKEVEVLSDGQPYKVWGQIGMTTLNLDVAACEHSAIEKCKRHWQENYKSA